MWQEVYLSAILRSILYADDANYRLAGFRKLDPIASLDAELKFVAAAEAAFFKGASISPPSPRPSIPSNELTLLVLLPLSLTHRLAARLGTRDPGRDRRLQSPHERAHEVLWRLVPLRAGRQPVREARRQGGRGRVLARAELPRHECVPISLSLFLSPARRH